MRVAPTQGCISLIAHLYYLLFSIIAYGQKHFGFSTSLPSIILLKKLYDDVINLAKEIQHFLKFDQSVFEFDFQALGECLSCFFILRFVSLVIYDRLCDL